MFKTRTTTDTIHFLYSKMVKSSIFVVLLLIQCLPRPARASKICAPSACGGLRNISYPFRLTGDHKKCGLSDYELSCENNQTVLHLYNGKYNVQSINYSNYSLRIVDSAVNQTTCSAVPRNSLAGDNFSFSDPYSWIPPFWDLRYPKLVAFLKCDNPVNSEIYVETAPCINGSGSFSYVVDGFKSVAEVEDSCTVELMAWSALPARGGRNVSFKEIHKDLAFGFEIWYYEILCASCRNDDGKLNQVYRLDIFKFVINQITENIVWILMVIGAIVVVRIAFGMPLVLAFLAYTWSRRHKSMYSNIEEFLQSENNLAPVRYSYSEIKKMTNNFKYKLGQGGFGSVYKAKLRSGRFAAIKMLSNTKSNGQDFINEVSSIGRVHHVNVVRLIGFCAEGSKRALVYDFMPNGSLDKYVLSREGNVLLSWKQMHEISLGVARGIEYLHRGCEIQILHFDIKPHNILLDESFVPKISDFGLAKLHSITDATLTLTAARGTIGYIAPELFYKNIGGVSYKADVYSFGMLLLEMVGKKKNLSGEEESSSQMYFPNWVYNEVVDGKVSVNNAQDDEEKLVKKMVLVALWCIQMKPITRPSMNKVVEMLKGDLESLPLPPKPSLWPDEKPMRFEDSTDEETRSCFMLLDSSDSASLLVNSC